jgi:L-threonylcarbamoyladenylate synthase
MAIIGESVTEACNHLQNDVIGIPTETVYGLAGNALDAELVARIFQVKNRPTFDPLIVHTYSIEAIDSFAGPIPEPLMKLANHFWPGPLTLLIPRKSVIPEIVTNGLPNVAVRIPNHPLTLELLKLAGFPIAAPSANPFGYISPTTAQHVNDQLGNYIPYILDGGPCNVGLESTIAGMEDNRVTVFRLGGISLEDIIAVCGDVSIKQHSSNPQAPGMLDSHYAPKKKLYLGNTDELLKLNRDLNPVLIRFNSYIDNYPMGLQLLLSAKSDIAEAAINLFAILRKADESSQSTIIAELVPEEGLGRAINDRLKRAAH